MIAGIDFSTRAVDVVLLDEDSDVAEWHRVELIGQDAFARARDVKRAMGELESCLWDEVLAVGIEDPRGYGAGSLYRVQGAILSRLPVWTLVQPWIPSSWRKTVGLPGNASKQAVANFACNHRQVLTSVWPQDGHDAYCIALATRTLLEHKEAA